MVNLLSAYTNLFLQATAMFAEKAASLESTSALAMAEVGQQCILRGKIKESQRYYKVRYNNYIIII